MLAPGGAAVGYTWREQSSPYRGAKTPRSFDPIYLYEGDYAYLHGTRAGLKAEVNTWRFDAFVAERFDGYNKDRIPYGLEDQPAKLAKDQVSWTGDGLPRPKGGR